VPPAPTSEERARRKVGTLSEPKERAADWTEERVSEERASARRGKLGGDKRFGGEQKELS
jgi:hypothetical protein